MSREIYEKLGDPAASPAEQGRRLRHLLGAKGFTQVSVARRLGMRVSTFNGMVKGKQPIPLSVAAGLRDALRVSPHWLLWGEGPMDSDAAERRLGEGGVAELRLREAVELVEDALGSEAVDVAVDGRALAAAVREVMTAYARRREGQGMRVEVRERAAADPDTVVAFDPVDPPRVVELALEDVVWIEIDQDSMDPVLRRGQVAGVLPVPPEDGDLAIVEFTDGRQVFKRWLEANRTSVMLESVNGREHTALVPRRSIRRARKVRLGLYL